MFCGGYFAPQYAIFNSCTNGYKCSKLTNIFTALRPILYEKNKLKKCRPRRGGTSTTL